MAKKLFDILRPPTARGVLSPRPRPKLLLVVGLILITVYLINFTSHGRGYHVIPWRSRSAEGLKAETEEEKRIRETHEQALRDEFADEYQAAKSLPGNDAIYGNTLATLISKDIRSPEHDAVLTEAPKKPLGFAMDKPYVYNPYPAYHSSDWRRKHRGPYIACQGANGKTVEDMIVFKGHPHDFPPESFGSYDLLNMDGNLCFERETRLGPYGYSTVLKDGDPINWDLVNWGDLQEKCVSLNKERYDLTGTPNPYVRTVYPELFGAAEYPPPQGVSKQEVRSEHPIDEEQRKEARASEQASVHDNRGTTTDSEPEPKVEQRTAVLLRSYTGKKYTENDKQVMRALISELNLRTGGEYQVYLLLHVRDSGLDIFGDDLTYKYVLDQNVPKEFHGMTILWNDRSVWDIYTAMTEDNERSVHSAQWLSVQKFSLEHPEYDYIWNWEMDARFTGHHYDFLQKLQSFAKKQPRRGLWERNERYYIPSYHGDYDHDFRNDVEARTAGDQVWGPPQLPFIKPIGPKPPVSSPEQDPYQWGVGEESDLITLGPIFNPVGSNWIIRDHVWGYSDANHDKLDLPRRTTIVTQSRVSRRLLNIMHVENLRGNHIASEMTPQTVALLHGLKTVFAPHPVWFDRPWNGTFLAKWFNPGPRGATGGEGSPMGWGRERRYQGSTWYYRADPPARMYNNWMGYEDTHVGGKAWEEKHGRPCLPPMMIHPVKEVKQTQPGFETHFELAYG
ncbi:hypothetical protein D7B24_006896 [Verticillium nonalfalfae]|uniref:Major facilitator superfamily transporter n=1 Tax=Verticillium nonalfalfae TaxID=1051616 RepID=A0A3M9Y8V3_9PEZI|nr:uncharacterized protein D7B24_006896 [Verticillium nonalfalfae]RNJ56764.1 hypothetical protein D7B24_006896 [Verticillium nonalfalfae]